MKESLTIEINRLMSVLNDKENKAIRLSFGFNQNEPKTLRQIGKELHLSFERIRQIKKRALFLLRRRAKRNVFLEYLQ